MRSWADTRLRAQLVLTVLVAVGVIVLPGCASGEDPVRVTVDVPSGFGTPPPTATEPGESTRTETQSPRDAATAVIHPLPVAGPELARPDDIGAMATVTYYLELFEYSQATGDMQAWQELATPNCSYCAAIAGRTERLYDGGGWVEGDVLTVHTVEAQLQTGREIDYFVLVNLTESAHVFVYGSGKVRMLPERRVPFIAYGLVRVGERWMVDGVDTDWTS